MKTLKVISFEFPIWGIIEFVLTNVGRFYSAYGGRGGSGSDSDSNSADASAIGSDSDSDIDLHKTSRL